MVQRGDRYPPAPRGPCSDVTALPAIDFRRAKHLVATGVVAYKRPGIEMRVLDYPDPCLQLTVINPPDSSGTITIGQYDTFHVHHNKHFSKHLADRTGVMPLTRAQVEAAVLFDDLAEFAQWVRDKIGELDAHERDEFIHVNGERVFNPHTPEAMRASGNRDLPI